MSTEEPPFNYSNEFLLKLTKYKHAQRQVIISLTDKVNDHEATLTVCGEEKFFASNTFCKVVLDRTKWEFTNFEFNYMYKF